MRKLAFVLIALAAWAGRAEAGSPIFPKNYNPYTGRFAPNATWNSSPPRFSPIVGSATQTGHFANPIAGRAKYSGAALDPNTGRVFSFKFRQ